MNNSAHWKKMYHAVGRATIYTVRYQRRSTPHWIAQIVGKIFTREVIQSKISSRES